MLIFDRIRLQDIDRRNWQLWVLAIAMILILAGGLALHMYTLASASGFSLSQHAMLQGIIGFCVLALLFAGFDEIDIGIGGRAAEAVGHKLKTLGRAQQVLCVTHLPQIAAFADQHLAVEKREQDGRTQTRIRSSTTAPAPTKSPACYPVKKSPTPASSTPPR